MEILRAIDKFYEISQGQPYLRDMYPVALATKKIQMSFLAIFHKN